MITVDNGFPVRTGDTEKDLDNLFDYLYKLEREIRFELIKPEKVLKLSAGAEIRRDSDGLWIGSAKGDNGVYIKFGVGAFLLVGGNKREL